MLPAYCACAYGPRVADDEVVACETGGVRKGTGLLIVAGLCALGIGAAAPASGAREQKPKIVYLTFDDGPNGANDPRLLRVLRGQRVQATFFLLGQSVAADPGSVQRLYMRGHAIGNHSYTHTDMTHLSAGGIAHEIAATQRLLSPLGGKCFRPPYGAVNATVSGAVAAQGMKMVMWSVDPEDWAHQDTGYIVNHVLTHVRDRSVVLMHDGGGNRAATVSAVKALIPQLRARGYEFRTVPSCRVPLRGKATGLAQPPAPAPTPTPTVTPTTSASPSSGVVTP